MKQDIVEFFQQFDKTSVVILLVCVIILVIFYIKRNSKNIRDIVNNALIETETYLNSSEGQRKIENGITIAKFKLPFIVKLFITKRVVITIIEIIMNKISLIFRTGKEIDIIGNEDSLLDNVKKDIEFSGDSMNINFKKGTSPKEEIESNGNNTIYAELNAETDWHGKPKTTVTVGVKKKL